MDKFFKTYKRNRLAYAELWLLKSDGSWWVKKPNEDWEDYLEGPWGKISLDDINKEAAQFNLEFREISPDDLFVDNL